MSDHPRIVLIGQPNAGKTTLFNRLTGLRYHEVNYPGSTVEYRQGPASDDFGVAVDLIDTPGITTLRPESPDQQVAVDRLFNGESDVPRCAILVADATQLTRQLYLFSELRRAQVPVVVALTMIDLLKFQGRRCDTTALSRALGVPVVAVNAREGEGLEALLSTVIEMPEAPWPEVCPVPPDESWIRKTYLDNERIVAQALPPLEDTMVDRLRRRLDSLTLHPVLGLVTFLAVMTGLFSSIFWAAAPLMDWVDAGFTLLAEGSRAVIPPGWLQDLVADGIVMGVGSVAVFVPQIAILFLGLSLLEDSGYLARGAMLMDRPLQALGLDGRAFVPVISGFACAIPAILSARAIAGRRERWLTILILPLMTCSARLPVYALLISFLIPADQSLLGGAVMTGLYLAGLLVGALVATVASRTGLTPAAGHAGFCLELPAWRRPLPLALLTSVMRRTGSYLRKAGPTILVIAISLWSLLHLPMHRPLIEEPGAPEVDEIAAVQNSWAAGLGRHGEVVTRPMGLDWRGGVALIAGFAAREVFVSALAVAYSIDAEDEDEMTGQLLQSMRTATFAETDRRIFTTSTCVGLLIFFAFALQCFPTVIVAQRETGSWNFALGQLVVYTGGAYLAAVIAVQGLRSMGVA